MLKIYIRHFGSTMLNSQKLTTNLERGPQKTMKKLASNNVTLQEEVNHFGTEFCQLIEPQGG